MRLKVYNNNKNAIETKLLSNNKGNPFFSAGSQKMEGKEGTYGDASNQGGGKTHTRGLKKRDAKKTQKKQ